MEKDKDNTTEQEKDRYVQSKVIENFLLSSKGLSFLIDKGKIYKFDSKKTLDEQIDDILDFYTAWAEECPVRKGYRSDAYTVIKLIEKFCSKKRVQSRYSFIL